MDYFDSAAWRQAAGYDDWYLRIQPEYQALQKTIQENPNEALAIKTAVLDFFEDLLTGNELALGGPRPEVDAERQPIRQAVIHHSKKGPGYYSPGRLNAAHLLRLYMPYYCEPSAEDRHLKGKPISSNHYQNGKMIFYGYHWWVEQDGTTTRLLSDEAVGWQAGNWRVNCQSVGICINDDLSHGEPSSAALRAVVKILQDYTRQLGALEVVGHCEVNPHTVCPGDKFLEYWKQELVEDIR